MSVRWVTTLATRDIAERFAERYTQRTGDRAYVVPEKAIGNHLPKPTGFWRVLAAGTHRS